MAIRSDDDVNHLLGRPEGAEVDEAALEYARRLAKRRGIPWDYGESDDDLPVYVQRALAEREARRAMHAAGISEEDRQRAREEAFRARAEDILAIIYRGAVVGAAQAARGRAAELQRELLGLARSAQAGVDSPAGRALAKRALDPNKSRILHACIELGKSVTDADVEAALVPTKPRRNPTDVRLFNSLKVFDRFSPDEREWLRLAFIEIVFNSVGIDHYDRDATSDELLEEYGADNRLTGKSVIDGCAPWLAQRLSKERFQNQRDADALLDALRRRFRALCTWATETRQNLAGMSIQQALEESQGYQSFAQRKGKVESDVNPTLYRFADGWKVVELRTEKALEREGDLMDHCVGGYFEQVESGESRIFSLRDPDNEPHITMEYQPAEERFTQIFGPSNEEPEKYTRPYLREFIEERFGGDPVALLKIGIPRTKLDLRGADLRGADLRGMDFQGAHLEEARLEDAKLQSADLKGAHLEEARLQGAKLRGADLRGAHLQDAKFLQRADFRGVKLQGADLRGAELEEANFQNEDLRKADLRGAKLQGATLKTDLEEAKLQGAFLQGANLRGAFLQGAFLQGAKLQGAKLQGAYLEGANLEGALYDDETTWPDGFDPDAAGAIYEPDED